MIETPTGHGYRPMDTNDAGVCRFVAGGAGGAMDVLSDVPAGTVLVHRTVGDEVYFLSRLSGEAVWKVSFDSQEKTAAFRDGLLERFWRTE